MNRRHDIDALRALAFGLVILYHVAMPYVEGWHWHLKSEHLAAWLQWPMRALNLWRMDLVFLVSGLAMGFLLREPDRLAVLRQRSLRLLLPLVFGMAVVVPYQAYAQGVAQGLIEPGFGAFLLRYYSGGPWPAGAFDGWDFGVTWNHLWYLPYLWVYTALLLALHPLLARGRRRFVALRGARLLVLPVLPLALYSLTLWPRFPPSHDLVHDAWLHAVYFTLFVYGWWLGVDPPLWAEIVRLRRRALALAVLAFGLYAVCRTGVGGIAPSVPTARLVADVYRWAVILAVLGHAGHHLNRPWPWLAWARESVYPWYLLHQTLIVAALVWLVPLRLGPVLEPVAVLGFTVAGCWLLTDGAVRRLRWLRPLFGLGPAPRAARATQTPRPLRPRPARPGTRAGAPPPSTRR